MVSCFWCAESKSFGSLAGSRALMGFCMAPMEALVPASISDIWFLHERGFRNAIFNLGVLGGINLASPIGEHLSSRKALVFLSLSLFLPPLPPNADIPQPAPSSSTAPSA